jgi:S-formylglutathione hydrolase FrmB
MISKIKIYLILVISLFYISTGLSAQQQFVFESDQLNKKDTVLVFTPHEYDSLSNRKFPAIYLLHGWSGNHKYWNDIIGCQDYANKYEIIIICPDGLYDSWYINSPVSGENKFENFFFNEMVPFISENFKIAENDIYITGLSMGGHGALYLFENNTTYFNGAGSLSGLLELTQWENHYGISRILGLKDSVGDTQILKEYSVSGSIDNLNSINKKIIISCGTEDPFHEINKQFVELCKRKSIDVDFIEKSGGHNSTYWRSAIDDHFLFFLNKEDDNN